MSKISSTTKANSVFLATVLVAGIIALSYPSFMIGAQAQQFNGMDQRYNSYEPEYGQTTSTIAMNKIMDRQQIQ